MGGLPKDKDVRNFIRQAEELGWEYRETSGPAAHPAGFLLCPESSRNGCRIAVYSTPRGNQLRVLERQVARCTHLGQAD